MKSTNQSIGIHKNFNWLSGGKVSKWKWKADISFWPPSIFHIWSLISECSLGRRDRWDQFQIYQYGWHWRSMALWSCINLFCWGMMHDNKKQKTSSRSLIIQNDAFLNCLPEWWLHRFSSNHSYVLHNLEDFVVVDLPVSSCEVSLFFLSLSLLI